MYVVVNCLPTRRPTPALHLLRQQKQKKRVLIFHNFQVGAFALSEVVSGSDAFAMQTVAKKDGDHFILNGSKWGISNAPIADFFLVLANADPEKGYRGVTCFIVDRDHEGVVLGEQVS